MPDTADKVYLLQIINVVATCANAFEMFIMLVIGYVDAINEKALTNTTWDTNESYEDVLDTRDYDGSTLVVPVLLCDHYGQPDGVISLINNPKWDDSTIGHINPLDGTYPRKSVVQIVTRYKRYNVMLMSEKLCGDMWAPIVVALAMGTTSAVLGIVTYVYAYSEALIGGIAAVTLGPTVVGFFSCVYYVTRIFMLVRRTFDMHDVEKMRRRSGNMNLKRMILVKEKTTLQIMANVTPKKLSEYFAGVKGIEELLRSLPPRLEHTASMRAQGMIEKANHMKNNIVKGNPPMGYGYISFVKLSSILEKVNDYINRRRLCKNVYNAAICHFKQERNHSDDMDGFAVTKFEEEQVIRAIIQQAVNDDRVIIKNVSFLSCFFDLQNVRRVQRSDWTINGEVDGW